jgi:predicted deacylase
MRRETFFTIDSPNRAPLQVDGFRFSPKSGKKKTPALAIIGSLNGNAIDQLFVASQIVEYLRTKEEFDPKFITGEILVIPSVNHFALNMGETYWPLDKTDINMMFPGYAQGETTQRIAHKLFEAIKDFDYGIILENRRDKADCIPYVKLIKSGYEDLKMAKLFGMHFIHHRQMEPIETVSLQYNWQLWGTKACSIVFGHQGNIKHQLNTLVIDAIIRFMGKAGFIRGKVFDGYQSNVVTRSEIDVIKAPCSGIFDSYIFPGESVKKDQTLGRIINALEGRTLATLKSPSDGIISCKYNYSLIFENSIAYRLIRM